MQFVYSTRNPQIPAGYACFDGMHTRCELLLPHLDEQTSRELCTQIRNLVMEAEGRYNRFDPASELSLINRGAAMAEVPAEEEMFMLLELCQTFSKATLGWFDISANPSSRCIERGWDLSPEGHGVRFLSPAVQLDLGGIVKGFVLDKAMRIIKDATDCAIVSFGGSSTAALGRHPLGAPWPVSISHPYYPRRTAWTFSLHDISLSVSGKNPRGRGHIIDPHTGNILEKDSIMAVSGSSALVCEVLSTALWIAPDEERPKILSSFEGYFAREIHCHADGRSTSIVI